MNTITALAFVATLVCVSQAQFFGNQAGAGSSTRAAVQQQNANREAANLAARQANGQRNKAAAQNRAEAFANERNNVKLHAHNDVAKDKKIQLSFASHDQERSSKGVKFAQDNAKAVGARRANQAALANENFNNAAIRANQAAARNNRADAFFQDNEFFGGANRGGFFGNNGFLGGFANGGAFGNGFNNRKLFG